MTPESPGEGSPAIIPPMMLARDHLYELAMISDTAGPSRTNDLYGGGAKRLLGPMRCLALLAFMMLAACNEEPPARWLSDTGVPFVDYGLVWVDNERLLFQRMEQRVAKPNPTDPWGAFAFPLSIWSLDGGLRTLTRADISEPCFARETGTLSYRITRDAENEPTFRIGKPDAMMDRPLEAEAADRMFNPFTCAFQSRPHNLSGHTLIPLRPGHGIVDLSRPGREDTARLLSVDGRSFDLPFDRTIVSPEGLSADVEGYWVVAEAVVFKAHGKVPCRPVWRLTPDRGASEEACLPEMSSSRVVRTALGWALDKREYDGDGSVGDSGIFLITAEGNLVKLAAGFTENLAVSPDGCRLAFGHAPDLETSCLDGTYGRKTVKLIDLCALEREIHGR